MLWLVFGEINYNALPCCLKIILERSTRPSKTALIEEAEEGGATTVILNTFVKR